MDNDVLHALAHAAEVFARALRAKADGSSAPPPPKLVVARTYQQFAWWCRENGYRPNGVAPSYVSSVQTIRGHRLHPRDVVFAGDWWRRPDAEEIEHALRSCGWRHA